jgi:hypothetical protein
MVRLDETEVALVGANAALDDETKRAPCSDGRFSAPMDAMLMLIMEHDSSNAGESIEDAIVLFCVMMCWVGDQVKYQEKT